MVYIPGPGTGNTQRRENREKTDKKKIKIEKPGKREKKLVSKSERPERIVEKPIQESKISHSTDHTSPFHTETKIVKDREEKKQRFKKQNETKTIRYEKKRDGSNFIPYFLTVIAIIFAVMAFYKMIETENNVTKRMDTMSAKYNTWYQEIKQQSSENSELLKPNGLINKTLIASSLMNEYIVGIDDVINASQEKDFSKVAFARIFISGSSPVYISIEGNSKVLFAGNMHPGLSDERFYYYKQPQTLIEGKTIVVPRNFKINSGNYENTYILFFNFGDTKLAKMDTQKISNVTSKYNIWLPAN